MASGIKCIAPPFLRPGDRIAMISPAYYTPDENLDRAAEILHLWGFELTIGAHARCLDAGRYAGTDAERLADLRAALHDPTVRAIVCNRGGYGTFHFVEALTAEDFTADPKWLVGFSDITTLLSMEACAGVMSIHGPMDSMLAASSGQDESCLRLHDLLLGTVPAYKLPPHPLSRPGKASGMLVGGNLSTLVPLLETWADVTRRDGFILFIEEIEESMHHIDRMLHMLLLRGLAKRCRGIILGDFTGCAGEFTYGSVEEMIMRILPDWGVPVLCGFPAGHGEVNLPLVMGAQATLEVRGDGAGLDFLF